MAACHTCDAWSRPQASFPQPGDVCSGYRMRPCLPHRKYCKGGRSNRRVVAIDVDPRALRVAEKHANAVGLKNMHFILAGAGEGKLGQSRFDRAVLVAALRLRCGPRTSFSRCRAFYSPRRRSILSWCRARHYGKIVNVASSAGRYRSSTQGSHCAEALESQGGAMVEAARIEPAISTVSGL